MAATENKFKLRAMQPSDSAEVNRLISTFEGELITNFLVDTYTAIISGTRYETLGVVVESAGHDSLIGMGTMRFGKVRFNGDELPLAFLDGLKVDPNFRKQGLGYQIANWRVQQARKRYGDECVVGTAMEVSNLASKAVAAKWCREFIDPAIEVRIMPVRTKAPKFPDGIKVREVEQNEFEEFASRQNLFYKDYNLYESGNAEMIESALNVAVSGRKPYKYYAAIDQQGNLLAGAQTWTRGLLKADTLHNPPPPLRIINNFFHLLPADFVIRDIAVNGLWHQLGNLQAAYFLWESIRWLSRDQATTVIIGLDPKDPLQEIVKLRPWHQPRPKVRLAIHGPNPIDRDRLVCGIGRV